MDLKPHNERRFPVTTMPPWSMPKAPGGRSDDDGRVVPIGCPEKIGRRLVHGRPAADRAHHHLRREPDVLLVIDTEPSVAELSATARMRADDTVLSVAAALEALLRAGPSTMTAAASPNGTPPHSSS